MIKKDVTLILGDRIEKMKTEIDNESIDLTITSPPYDNLRTYNDSLVWDESIWQEVIKELWRVTKPGGAVVWVVGDATIKGSETGTSFRQALFFKECGFNLHDTMIYKKNGQGAVGSNYAYWSSFEYMFVFSKEKLRTFNPIKDRKNAHPPRPPRLTTIRRGEKTIRRITTNREYGKRGNIWKYNTGGKFSVPDPSFKHPAVFPEPLANDHILSWSNVNDIIFDPFMGSGTAGKMAALNNRRFIGIEKDEAYFKIAEKRIAEAIK